MDEDSLSETEEDGVCHFRSIVPTSRRSQKKSSLSPCTGCGGNHAHAFCHFKSVICCRCGKKGHLAKVCRAPSPSRDQPSGWPAYRRPPARAPRTREDCFAVIRDQPQPAIAVSQANVALGNKIYFNVHLEGAPCSMAVDTGSAKSVVSWATIKHMMPTISKKRLSPCYIQLWDYQGNAIPIVGSSKFRVTTPNFNVRLPLIVVQGNLPSLLGLDWFDALGLGVSSINTTTADDLGSLTEEFATVFDGQLGKYIGTPISFNLDPQVPPIHLKPRRVPLALHPKS